MTKYKHHAPAQYSRVCKSIYRIPHVSRYRTAAKLRTACLCKLLEHQKTSYQIFCFDFRFNMVHYGVCTTVFILLADCVLFRLKELINSCFIKHIYKPRPS